MSTTHEGPEMPNGPYTGMSVQDLEDALQRNRSILESARYVRGKIKSELKVAKAREANEPRPIPENPAWDVFEFNAKLTNDDRTRVYTGTQQDGKIAVVAGDGYWFFEDWENFVGWLRDPEFVDRTSVLRPMTRSSNVAGLAAR